MTMYLSTDEQTIEDLRLFAKRDIAGIYDIYNNTHTRGAEAVLEEMFRNPLSDKDLINKRKDIIEQFAKQSLSFPFEPALFDMAEKYLNVSASGGDGGRDRNAALSEKDINNGVAAVLQLLQQLKQFVQRKEVAQNTAYAIERETINQLLAGPGLAPVLRETNTGRLPYAAVTAYDLLFRVQERSRIEKLMACIYMLDIYISIAGIAVQRNFSFPVALDKQQCRVRLEGVYHPEVKDAVSNDFEINAAHNLIFLTGANMAGKSTVLRAISIAVYLAHMGFPVAARSMEFSVMDGIYTTINLPDNLGIGASHFYAEVLRVKKVATEIHAGKSLFIVFDELFRGTNVKDAHEATVAVATAFAKNLDSLFIISSHIVEAGEELQRHPTVDYLFLPTRMNGHTPEYTYKLQKGITSDRHGMIIIRNEGILEILKNGRQAGRKKIMHQEK